MAIVQTEVASAAGGQVRVWAVYDNVTGAMQSVICDNAYGAPVTVTVQVRAQPLRTVSQTFGPGMGQTIDLTTQNVSVTINADGSVNWPPISIAG